MSNGDKTKTTDERRREYEERIKAIMTAIEKGGDLTTEDVGFALAHARRVQMHYEFMGQITDKRTNEDLAASKMFESHFGHQHNCKREDLKTKIGCRCMVGIISRGETTRVVEWIIESVKKFERDFPKN